MLVGLTVGINGDTAPGEFLPRITLSAAPTISGDTTSVGQLVLDPLESVTPSDAVVALQWQRDGSSIPQATTSVYSKSIEDAGAELRVALYLTRAGFAPLTVYSNAIRIDAMEWVILGSVIHGVPITPSEPSVANLVIGS